MRHPLPRHALGTDRGAEGTALSQLVKLSPPFGPAALPAFGKDRLRDVIRESAAGSAAEIAKAIRDRLGAFRGDTKQVDDVTFVIVKVRPAQAD